MRLLGGADPHDVLLGTDPQIAHSRMSWSIEANINDSWLPIPPTSNSFRILGTNKTGTYALRNMTLTRGAYSLALLIAYEATVLGPLKWDISFLPANTLSYRIVYSWSNLPTSSSLNVGSKTLSVRDGLSNYAFSWADVPATLNSTTSMLENGFSLNINLGLIRANSRINIDPSLISTSSYSGATDFQFQRKIFQDSTGRYFVFYYNGSSVYYASSPDGITWSAKQSMPTGWPSFLDAPTSLPSVAYYGGRVVVAAGDYLSNSLSYNANVNLHLRYSIGTISGGSIAWATTGNATASVYHCLGTFGCNAILGVRYVYAMLAPNGDIAFSYNAYNGTTSCCNNYQSVGLIYLRGASQYSALVRSYQDCGNGPGASVVVPEGDPGNGVVRVVYEDLPANGTCLGGYLQLSSVTYSSISNQLGSVDQAVSQNVQNHVFSVTTDAGYNIHVVYLVNYGNSGGPPPVSYIYHKVGSSWTSPASLFQNNVNIGFTGTTITTDLSTDTVYALAWIDEGPGPQGYEVYTMVMTSKTPAQDVAWHDSTTIAQFRNRVINPSTGSFTIGSALAQSSSTNASKISLVWTEGYVAPYNIMFGAIPIQTVWSPYASPSYPWNGNGIAPNGQYIRNLDEAVSPNTGTLTISQTDFNVPGRGLNLEITRIFGGASRAPVGIGWGLNFPLYDGTNNVVYLWNGESYKFPVNWLNGCYPHCSWENHQGEYFRLVQNSDYTIDLITKIGVIYHFDNTGNYFLLRITDSTGNNSENFNYNGLTISSITDTVGRVFLFCYTSFNYLASIDQVSSGTCSSETGFVRRVSYSYSNPAGGTYDLASVTDPAGRTTQFQYSALADSSATRYYISRVTYPTSWYSNYTYLGDTVSQLPYNNFVYRVAKQIVYSSTGAIIRQFTYSYLHDSNSGMMTAATVTAYNGTSVGNYINYAYSFGVVKSNVSDPQHPFVRGTIQTFGVHGEVPQETFLVTDGSGNIGSYTNYYRYDYWGDLIYTRSAINPSAKWYHDSFNAFYNNGLAPGFNSFQETFSQQNITETDNFWYTYNGTWRVRNGAYNGTSPSSNPTHQEGFFAWTNATTPSISLIASIYITKQTSTSDARVGLITHYPGYGMRKWALVIHNSTSGVKLSLLDEYVAWRVENPCTLNYNSWYRFNFTTSGSQAWGSATAPGVSCSVSGTFTSNDISLATGFGLYSGGYSALFDNVTATTVALGITGTSFSNSFYQNGAPGTTVHGLPAGRAALQNGTSSAPIETYYSYSSWGGLNQAKTRLGTGGATQWLQTSRTYDAFGNLLSVMDPRGNYTYLTYSAGYLFAYVTNETQVLIPGSKITQLFTYDMNLGTLRSRTDPNGNISTYQYDILGRLTSTDYPTNSPGQPQIDGSAIAECSNLTQSCSVAFQTSHPNDIIIVFTSETLDQVAASCTFSVSDTAGLSWTLRAGVSGRNDGTTGSNRDQIAEFWAKSTGALSSDMINESISNCGPNYNGLQVFAISGANFNSPFDPNSALPGTGTDAISGQQATTSATISTTNSKDLVFAGVQHGTGAVASPQSGFTSIISIGGYGAEYQIENSIVTNFAVTFSFGVSSYWQEIADAIQLSNQVSYPDYVRYTYNDAGNYVDATNENGWLTRQVFDGIGRTSGLQRFLGGMLYSNTPNTYNWMDETVSTRDSLGNFYQNSYDAIGRITSSTTPDNKIVSQLYNDTGSWSLTTDPDSNSRCSVYDRLGRLISVVEYANSNCTAKVLNGYSFVTNYYYDEVGNLRRISNAATKSTSYSYDNLYRLLTANYPDGTSETYSYDKNGNLISKIDRASLKTLSAYDSLNRVTTATFCGASTAKTTGTNYAYDKDNNIVSLQNQNATISYLYDARNRVLNETYRVNPTTRTITDLGCFGSGGTITRSGGGVKTVSFTFSYLGEMLSGLVYPTTNVQKPNIAVSYSYDQAGRLLNVSSPFVVFAKFSYDSDDRTKGIQYGNGLIMNYTYDPMSRISLEQLNNTSTHTTLLRLAYTYNNTGTVASLTGQVNQAKVNEQYRYDPLQRLTNSNITSQGANRVLSYTLDNLGNRLSQTVNGTITNYTYNSTNNELKSAGTTTYTYDGNGNLLSKTTGSTTWTYTWDPGNHLLQVANGTPQGTYAYDGSGRMVEAMEGSPTNFFAYLGTATLWKNGTDYIYAGSRLVAFTSDNLSYHTPRYYHTDGLGSVRLMTKDDATVWYSDGYQPYGQDNGTPTCPTCPTAPQLKFTGKPVSATTGLYYYYHRWYDPSIGRFISPDSLAGHRAYPQSLNRYLYVLNSPTSSIDSAGLDCFSSWTDFGGCAGGFLETLGPENGVINIGEKLTGVNTDQLVSSTLGPTAAQVYTGSRMLSGGAFLASGLVAGAALLAPLIGIGSAGGGAATALGVCEEDPQACEPPPTPPEPPPTTFYRYVTTSQLQNLQEDPVLVPGGPKAAAFFTDEIYDSQSLAFQRLSLPELKDFRIAFQFIDNPDITGPDIAQPRFTSAGEIITQGGGIEYFIKEIATIELIGVPIPLGP